jgi:hypothetical protein
VNYREMRRTRQNSKRCGTPAERHRSNTRIDQLSHVLCVGHTGVSYAKRTHFTVYCSTTFLCPVYSVAEGNSILDPVAFMSSAVVLTVFT